MQAGGSLLLVGSCWLVAAVLLLASVKTTEHSIGCIKECPAYCPLKNQ